MKQCLTSAEVLTINTVVCSIRLRCHYDPIVWAANAWTKVRAEVSWGSGSNPKFKSHWYLLKATSGSSGFGGSWYGYDTIDDSNTTVVAGSVPCLNSKIDLQLAPGSKGFCQIIAAQTLVPGGKEVKWTVGARLGEDNEPLANTYSAEVYIHTGVKRT